MQIETNIADLMNIKKADIADIKKEERRKTDQVSHTFVNCYQHLPTLYIIIHFANWAYI